MLASCDVRIAVSIQALRGMHSLLVAASKVCQQLSMQLFAAANEAAGFSGQALNLTTCCVACMQMTQ